MEISRKKVENITNQFEHDRASVTRMTCREANKVGNLGHINGSLETERGEVGGVA
jgi:hypothetical protein